MTTVTATRTTNSVGWERLAGLGGVAFAAIVAADNIALPSSPDFDASGAEVMRWVHDHHLLVATIVGSFAVTAVCLATFIGGFVARALRDESSETRVLALVGAFGATMVGAWFALVIVSQLVLVALDGSSTTTPAIAELVWHLHAAAFMINIVAIGIAVFGVGGAAVRLGLAPEWYRPLSIVALVAAVAASLQSASAVNGAPGWQVGLIPFVCWLLLLAIVGTRMVRQTAG